MSRLSSCAPAGELGPGVIALPVQKVNGVAYLVQSDMLAVEEPLEIRLGFDSTGRRTHQAVSVTMRTPGNDPELAAGFLFTEGIITDLDDVQQIRPCGLPRPNGQRNVVRVELKAGATVDLERLQRHFYTSSSCGVCGKTSIAAVSVGQPRRCPDTPSPIAPEIIYHLPRTLRTAQEVFERTGGLHAAALFDRRGDLLDLREDVGRHNALDKLIGAQFLARSLPLTDRILLLSGRASFELVQKAMMAEVPLLAAVGAPSSLAVELARASNMTVLGFVRDGRFNIYTGAERVAVPQGHG